MNRWAGAVSQTQILSWVPSAVAPFGEPRRFDDISAALAARMDDVRLGHADWAEILLATSAQDAVSLMTIHRSKGLEFHTVFLLCLDEKQWWAYQRDPREATSAFFVGLSRAGQRIVVTRATANAGGANTARFYQLLEEAGVEVASPD